MNLGGGGGLVGQKEISRAEHEYMNIYPPPPPPHTHTLNALVTSLIANYFVSFKKWLATSLIIRNNKLHITASVALQKGYHNTGTSS